MWLSKKKSRVDVFAHRNKQQQLWDFVHRLIDSYFPNVIAEQYSNRTWERANRCLPVAFLPFIGDEFVPSQSFYAPTKELSKNGICLITSERVECTYCICGFWLDSPRIVGGVVRRIKPFGGNMFEVGIELIEIVESSEILSQFRDQLQALAPAQNSVASAQNDASTAETAC